MAVTRLSDAEWAVMGVLWEGGPRTAREVLEAIGGETGWAYTTVKTMLDRLVEKGVVRARTRGQRRVYQARLTRERARGSALRSLLDHAFDGTVGTLVQHLATEQRLSRRDRERLGELLAELDREEEPE